MKKPAKADNQKAGLNTKREVFIVNQIANFHKPTMSSVEIAGLVDSRHDKVKQSIERLVKRDVIQLPPMGEVKDNQSLSPNSMSKAYIFEGEQGKRDSFVVVAQLSPEFTARLVDRWQELEQQAAPALPDFTDPIAAAEAWIEAKKAERLAVATKAEIGSRREATAMNTASIATRRASKLERDLDRSKEYCTIKRMTMLTHGQSYNWRLLKSASQELGIPPIDVFDANYGTVKAYHADAWMEAYGLEVAA